MQDVDLDGGRENFLLIIMLCKRCDTIFKRDGRTQKICRPCQTIAREKSYKKRNETNYYLGYHKNTITSITKYLNNSST